MKKVLLSTVVLFAFSLSMALFQMSCQKSSYAASTNTTTTQKNKLIYLKEFEGSGTQLYDYGEIWTCSYDGTGQTKLNITLPTNTVIALVEPKVSPDGKTLFFNVLQTDGTQQVSGGWSLYACDIDGSNVRQVVAATGNSVVVSAAY